MTVWSAKKRTTVNGHRSQTYGAQPHNNMVRFWHGVEGCFLGAPSVCLGCARAATGAAEGGDEGRSTRVIVLVQYSAKCSHPTFPMPF